MSDEIFVSMDRFAEMCHGLLKTDRDGVIGVAGFTGEGKSCFSTQLAKAYAKRSGAYFGMDRITWSREEMMKWIDGEPKSEKMINGLKPQQLEEYSVIIPDELFFMFYKRTWYEDGQISAVSTFNSCRDRHLLVIGNVPDFWDLDGGFTGRVRFYVYIPIRGTAWVFRQEENPFSKDPWNMNDNKKMFRKGKKPYKLPNFVCEVKFDDWTPQEKAEYYKVRNEKRVTELNSGKKKKETYKDIKDQRNNSWVFYDNLIKVTIKKYKFIKINIDTLTKHQIIDILKPYMKLPSNELLGDNINVGKDIVRIGRKDVSEELSLQEREIAM